MQLHALWFNGFLWIWSDSPLAQPAPAGEGGHAHPRALATDALRAVLGDCCSDGLVASAAAADALTLRLPADETGPLRANADGATAVLSPFTIPALRFTPTEAVDLLVSLPDALPDGCGPSMHYWRNLARFVVERLARLQFYPDLFQPTHGQYLGQWRLLATTAAEAAALEQYAAAMPPVCQAVASAPPEAMAASRLVETFLHATTDALIRRDVASDEFFNRAHEKAGESLSPPEVRWLSALLGRDATVRGDGDDLARFAEQVRGWVGRLDETRADDALRLAFELIEPDEDEDDVAIIEDAEDAPVIVEDQTETISPSDTAHCQLPTADSPDSRPWRLTFMLEPGPEADGDIIGADELWKDESTGILGRSLAARRQRLTTELARAAQLYPTLDAALGQARPCELSLGTMDAHVFIRQWAQLLSENGFGVRLPNWTMRRDREIGLLMTLRPGLDDAAMLGDDATGTRAEGAHFGDVSSGRLGLEHLLDFDWQVAVGDLKLTVEEFRTLAERRQPLVKYKGQWIHLEPESAQRAMDFVEEKGKGKITLAEAFRTAYGIGRADTGLPILGLSGLDWIDHLLKQSPGQLENLQQPEAFKGTLRPYQTRGLQWLAFLDRLGIGACLADDMGLGKAQPLDAKILTPTGWRTMGEMNVGDTVIRADGQSAKVIGVYPQGEREVFDVTFSDNSRTQCCDEHLWQVNTPVRKYRGQEGRVLPLGDIRKQLRDTSDNSLHFVPMVSPIKFGDALTDRPLPLHPYLLGALLGDGGIAHRCILSSADQELLDHVKTMLPEGVSLNYIDGVDYRIACAKPGGCNPVLNALKTMGLRGLGSHQKFVPDLYKWTTVANRTELLQGLLDTDGHVRPADNNIEYCTVSEQLAKDVQFLVQSLGGTAAIRTKQTTGRLAYRMSVILPESIKPFNLSRKATAYHPRAKYPPTRAIVEVKSIGQKPCQCIAVDAADQLYVTDDFIVTHNTIQLIALMVHERAEHEKHSPNQGKLPPTLLFAPTSVVGNWVRELDRFAPQLSVLVHHGPARLSGDAFAVESQKHDIVVTSYALAHRDAETLAKPAWWRVALDEAQKIKNPSAASTQAIRAIPAPRRVALTGTPIENHLSELWSIMELLNPGLLGSAGEFRERFAVPIEKLADADRAQQLRKLIAPFVLRRTKSDPAIAGDLPEKMEQKVYCNLTTEQAAAYERITADMLNQIDAATGIRRRGLILAALTRLKQICDHPILLTKEKTNAIDGRSGKCERLAEMLEEVIDEGDAALIFTQYREMGHLLETMVRTRLKADTMFLHGGTPAKGRDDMIQRFQSGTPDAPRVFILSLRAGGLGLNLTAANHVFHFDRWWNPAVESQATDRAYRIGQTRKVQVHKFVCVGTVEERIDRLLTDKIALADRIVSSGDDWLTNLSTDDLRSYLQLSNDAVGDF